MPKGEAMGELQKQFAYYLAHQAELVASYKDRWVVLAGDTVAGDFGSEIEAYEYATTHIEPGHFVIQLVEPGQETYSQTFHSRVMV
jgi:hypothetical protein